MFVPLATRYISPEFGDAIGVVMVGMLLSLAVSFWPAWRGHWSATTLAAPALIIELLILTFFCTVPGSSATPVAGILVGLVLTGAAGGSLWLRRGPSQNFPG